MHRLALSLLAMVYPLVLSGMPQPLDIPPDLSVQAPKIDQVFVLEDKTNSLQYAEINKSRAQFALSENPDFNYGFSSSTYWFWSQLENLRAGSQPLLVFDYPLLDHVSVFLRTPNGATVRLQTGDRYFFSKRSISHRLLNLRLPLEMVGTYELFIKISGHSSLKTAFKIYDEAYFWQSEKKETNLNLLYFGALGVMIVYNFAIFLITRSRSYLLYVLYMGMFVIFQSGIAGFDYQYLWPEAVYIHEKIVPFSVSATLFFLALFTYVFLNLEGASRWIRWPVLGTGALAGLTSLSSFFLPYKPVVISATLCGFIVSLACFTPAVIYARKSMEARFYLAAFSCFLVGCLAFALQNFGVLPTNAFTLFGPQIGSAVEALLLSVALANRIRKLQDERMQLFEEVQAMNRNLESEVARKTKKVQRLLDTISQGIVSLRSEQLRFDQEYSAAALQILGVKELAGTSFAETFLARCDIANDAKSRIMSVLTSSIGNSCINFDVNLAHLPHELRFVATSGQESLLEIDWAYEANDRDEVEAIVLTLKDVTELRRLQADREKSKLELETLSEIFRLPKENFLNFCLKAQKIIEENIHILMHSNEYRESNLKMMFINFHTLKGNARQLRLSRLVEETHNIEQYYTNVLNAYDKWDHERCLADLNHVSDTLQSYIDQAAEKLGWRLGENETIHFHRHEVGEILDCIYDSMQQPDQLKEQSLNIYDRLSQRYYQSVESLLSEFTDDLSRMAKDLGKKPPYIEPDCLYFRVKNSAKVLMQDILLHMLRNSIDHGIESPAERLSAGKDEIGTIRVKASVQGEQFIIDFNDDGRGLPVDRLLQKFKKNESEFSLDPEDIPNIAAQIFRAGVSTSDNVSEISGRGVGMPAIKDYITKQGGSIELILGEVYQLQSERFVPVMFRMRFPIDILDPLFRREQDDEILPRAS